MIWGMRVTDPSVVRVAGGDLANSLWDILSIAGCNVFVDVVYLGAVLRDPSKLKMLGLGVGVFYTFAIGWMLWRQIRLRNGDGGSFRAVAVNCAMKMLLLAAIFVGA